MSDAGLYDRPVLVLDPGMHTAPIRRADVDRAGRFAVTASRRQDRAGLVAGRRRAPAHHPPAGRPRQRRQGLRRGDQPRRRDDRRRRLDRQPTADAKEQIYLFDRRQRRDDRPHRRPAERGRSTSPSPAPATAGGGALAAGGLRLYARDGAGRWTEVAADSDYGGRSYGVAFAADGRLATTSWDGRLRLYDPDGALICSVSTTQR